jgi:hypothetical protein
MKDRAYPVRGFWAPKRTTLLTPRCLRLLPLSERAHEFNWIHALTPLGTQASFGRRSAHHVSSGYAYVGLSGATSHTVSACPRVPSAAPTPRRWACGIGSRRGDARCRLSRANSISRRGQGAIDGTDLRVACAAQPPGSSRLARMRIGHRAARAIRSWGTRRRRASTTG